MIVAGLQLPSFSSASCATNAEHLRRILAKYAIYYFASSVGCLATTSTWITQVLIGARPRNQSRGCKTKPGLAAGL
jgi:hypothetical protein